MRMQNRIEEFSFAATIFLLLFIYVSFSENGYAQDDIIRVNTDLVSVPVSVLDREGRYVTNLKKEDFQIFEDGVEQEITIFEPVEQSFTALILFDRSGSMSNHMTDLANAANAFVNQLRPNDQLSAATFAEYIDVLFQPTKIKDLKKGIKLSQRKDERYTMLYNAVDQTLKRVAKIPGRKAIIVFSDGFGAGTFTSAKENLRRAEEGEAIIYTIQFDTSSHTTPSNVDRKIYHKSIEAANNYMRDLAQITGGRHFQIEDFVDLEKTFAQIAEELGRQYSLGYYPKQLEAGQRQQIRQIKIKVKQPNLAVKARSSYIVKPQKNYK